MLGDLALGYRDVKVVFLTKYSWKILNRPDSVWVQLLKAKCLRNMNFLQIIKTNTTSNAWKHILDHRYLLRKGLM